MDKAAQHQNIIVPFVKYEHKKIFEDDINIYASWNIFINQTIKKMT